MKLFIAWIKKKLGIQSPSIFGYKYEYDYLEAKYRKGYKNFTYLEQPMEFCDTFLFSDNFDRIQIHDNNIVGFAGVCKVENGEVIPLDGDFYTKHMTVIAYRVFVTDNEELGLDLLVTDW